MDKTPLTCKDSSRFFHECKGCKHKRGCKYPFKIKNKDGKKFGKLVIFILLPFLTTSLFAGDKTFKTFQLNCVALDYIDISISLYGIGQGYEEVSSINRLYTRSEMLTLTIHTVLNIGTIMATNFIYKRDKRLAWVIVIGLNLIRAYAIYRNIKILTA